MLGLFLLPKWLIGAEKARASEYAYWIRWCVCLDRTIPSVDFSFLRVIRRCNQSEGKIFSTVTLQEEGFLAMVRRLVRWWSQASRIQRCVRWRLPHLNATARISYVAYCCNFGVSLPSLASWRLNASWRALGDRNFDQGLQSSLLIFIAWSLLQLIPLQWGDGRRS